MLCRLCRCPYGWLSACCPLLPGGGDHAGCRQRWRATPLLWRGGGGSPLPLREGLGGGSFVQVVSQLLADNYNHTHQFKGVIMSIVFVAI